MQDQQSVGPVVSRKIFNLIFFSLIFENMFETGSETYPPSRISLLIKYNNVKLKTKTKMKLSNRDKYISTDLFVTGEHVSWN